MAAGSARPYGTGREALIIATIDVVAARGLRGLTFRAVGEAAGVNNALVAHHFGTREGLLIAALEWTTEQAIERSALTNAKTLPLSFERSLDHVAVEERNLLVFQYELILEASRNVRFRAPIIALYRAYFDALVPEDTSDPALTRARFAALDGLVLQLVSGAITQSEFEASVHSVTELLRDGRP